MRCPGPSRDSASQHQRGDAKDDTRERDQALDVGKIART